MSLERLREVVKMLQTGKRGCQFMQSKRQKTWSTRFLAALEKRTKEQSMEYLILVAVVSMIALYALIIVGWLKQPEW